MCGNSEISIQPNDIFFIPYGCRYTSSWHGNDEIIWDSYAFLHCPDPHDIHYSMQKLQADESIRQMFDMLSDIGEVNCRSVGLLYTIFSLIQPKMVTESQSSSIMYKKAVDYISKNLTAAVADIAKFCNISESGLYMTFRDHGTTPMKIKNQLQLERAILLLRTTDLTVEDIAERTGLNSSAYLIRILKRYTGKTTREIRKNMMM
ncbi:MAG: helix-turn-helix transcriptional regulator [Clostridiales bacterium]|nr:helix-turn-helix transcriptional regulator [Clostridiales bacterium]